MVSLRSGFNNNRSWRVSALLLWFLDLVDFPTGSSLLLLVLYSVGSRAGAVPRRRGLSVAREVKLLMRLPDGRNGTTAKPFTGAHLCARTGCNWSLQTLSELGQRPPFAIGQAQATLGLISKNSILGHKILVAQEQLFVHERRCCTARSKSLTSLCRSESHPAQYVSGIPSAVILLSISHPIRCSTRCLANVRVRISGPMIAL